MPTAWARLLDRWRTRRHVSFARLVALADTARDTRDPVTRHVAACPRCAAALQEIVHATHTAQATSASPSETGAAVDTVRARLLRTLRARTSATAEAPEELPRLLATPAGTRVAGALAPWLGDTAARALLHHVRAGHQVRRDVLQAVASPLTAFLGEDAGRALAIQISRLAESRDDPPPRQPRLPRASRPPDEGRPIEVGA